MPTERPHKPSYIQHQKILEATGNREMYKKRKIEKQKNAAGLTEREEQMLMKRSLSQIRERNLDVPYGFESYVKGREITDRKKNPSMWLFRTSYLARYPGENWWIHASFLCGHSDGQDWAVRVPGTKTTVDEALNWLIPAQVKKAIKAKKEVHRQGDFYFVPFENKELIPPHDFSALVGTRHRLHHNFNEGGYLKNIEVTHPQHPSVVLDNFYTWRAVQQKQMAAGGHRVGAD